MSLSTAPGRGLLRSGCACPTPVVLVAIAAGRKRIRVMLSQVRRPEMSLSKRLDELVTLCEESIEVCALVPEFLDESPL